MPDIRLKNQCFDLAFSPTHDQVYVGLLTGEVKGFSYDDQGNHKETFSLRPSKQSCRGLAIDNDGKRLYTVSKDKSLRTFDPFLGQLVEERLSAHSSAINRVVVCTPNTLATGDDDGVVKLWDTRKPTEIKAFTRHIDYISDLLFTEDKFQIVATSGDCSLTVMDVRSSRLEPLAQSQDQDDEFLSVCSIKGDTKLVVGTQMGMLSIFNRSSASAYYSPVDRMPGHPASVDALVQITDDVIATGSADGLIRLVQIMPNKLLGAVADHGDFPVERLGLSRDGKWLGSASHDETLKLTDIADALEESDGEGEEAESNTVSDGDGKSMEVVKPFFNVGSPKKRPHESSDGEAEDNDHSDNEVATPAAKSMKPIPGPQIQARVRHLPMDVDNSEDERPTPRQQPGNQKRKNKKQKGHKSSKPAASSFFADL